MIEGPSGVRFLPVGWAEATDAGIGLVRAWRPDIVHLHTAMLWPVAKEIQRQTGVRLVFHVHSVDRAEYEIGEEPNPWLAHSEAQNEAILAADRVIAVKAGRNL